MIDTSGPSVLLQTKEGAIPLGDASGGGVELTALSEEVRIRSIQVLGNDGRDILVDDFAARAEPLVHWLWGALGGLLFGLFARTATRGKPPALGWIEVGLLAVPPLAVCLVAPADWLYLVERAYLVRTPAWGLARGLLLLSLLPTVGLAERRRRRLEPALHQLDVQRHRWRPLQRQLPLPYQHSARDSRRGHRRHQRGEVVQYAGFVGGAFCERCTHHKLQGVHK